MESNSPTHFPLKQQSNNEFVFTTNALTTYKVTAFESNLLENYPGIIYEISFWSGSTKAQYDTRISNTIIFFIEQLLMLNPENCISFVCDSSDSRENARKRLFNIWHQKHGRKFLKLDSEIKSSDNIIYYHSLITSTNNPFLHQLKDQYLSAIIEINKP